MSLIIRYAELDDLLNVSISIIHLTRTEHAGAPPLSSNPHAASASGTTYLRLLAPRDSNGIEDVYPPTPMHTFTILKMIASMMMIPIPLTFWF